MRSTAFALLFVAFLASTDCLASAKSKPNPTPSPTPTPTNTGTPQTPGGGGSGGGSDAYTGSELVTSAEYHLAASNDSQVLSGAATEPWAVMYRPVNMGNTPHPVIVMLHGNHATCGIQNSDGTFASSSCAYTSAGQCNPGETVIPNHLGYGYLATRLASYGYVVVSINTNLGINCGSPQSGDSGLILARGRMVLRHLQLLSQWNRISGTTPSSLGIDLAGKLDFSQVGLFGHSRGGEGIRAAFNLYQSETHWQSDIGNPVTFKALFEVGPVDGQSSMVLNPTGTAWNVLLPLCDGDVRTNEGMKPYDRSLAATSESPALPKSMFAVWGANHNFYNTYWNSSDSTGCVGTTPLWTSGASSSANEQQTAIAAVIPFFRSHLGSGADATQANVFNPAYALPSDLTQITRVDRAYVASSNQANVTRVETFQASAGTSSMGQANDLSNIGISHTTVPEHDASLKAAKITWNGSGSSVYFQDNWTAPGSGLDLSSTGSLDFRVSRAYDPSLNVSSTTDFAIQLVNPDGSLSQAVRLASYLTLVDPIGSSGSTGGSSSPDLHVTMITVRIPLAALGSPSSARGVRLTFDSTSSGDIYLSDIDLSAKTSSASTLALTRQAASAADPFGASQTILAGAAQAFEYLARGPAAVASRSLSSNQIMRISAASDGSANYEVQVASDDGFQVRDALPVLRLNGQEAGVGSFSSDGDLRTMTFKVNPLQLRFLPDQFDMEVGHREDPYGPAQSFGRVSKADFQ